MPQRISRREFAAIAIGAASTAPALAAGAMHNAQGAKTGAVQELDPVIAGDIAAIDKKLAKPLTEEARKLTITQLKTNKDALKDRYKFDLPENSEPCFVYPPLPAKQGSSRRRA